MKFAQRMENLGTEKAFEVLAEVQKLKAQGRDIVSLGIGDPDFDTPPHIRSAAARSLERGRTHYNPSAGIPELREAAASYLTHTRGVIYSPDEIVITPGAKPILFFSALALVNPGDEVLYPNPGFPIYESVIRFVGARPVPMPLVESREFSIDLDRVMDSINDRTKMIILNSPNNPTGGVMCRDDLRAVAEAAGRHNSWVLADEVYGEFLFEGSHESIVQFDGMKERTILLDGHSKTFAMTGWRLGYAGMPAPLAQKIGQLVTNSVSCTATFIQDAGLVALTGDWESVRSMIAEFKARRDLAWEALNETPGIACVKPRGAFYAWPNVTEACRILGVKNSEEFQDMMISEGGVAVLSRSCFGPRNEGETDDYVRISFATSRELLAEGIRRMRSLIEKHL